MYKFTMDSHVQALIRVSLVTLVLIGCAQQNPAPVSTVPATPVPVQSPAPTVTLAPTPTPIPMPTATSTPDLLATTVACNPKAQVTDVTVPGGSKFKPGETFVKVWRLLSSGNCAWEKGTSLVFQAGDKLGAPASLPVDAVEVGKSIEVSLTMTTPLESGTFAGLWALQRPAGQLVNVVDVSVVVIAPTPTPAVVMVVPPAPTQAPQQPFPKTAVLPWDQDGFIKTVQITRDSLQAFQTYFRAVVGGEKGNCGLFWGRHYGEWESRPVFTNVPARWAPLHERYRTILVNIRMTVDPITKVCLQQGGTISDETDRVILASVDNLLNQLNALYAEAQALK